MSCKGVYYVRSSKVGCTALMPFRSSVALGRPAEDRLSHRQLCQKVECVGKVNVPTHRTLTVKI